MKALRIGKPLCIGLLHALHPFIAPDAVTLTKEGDLSFFAKQDEVIY